MIKAIIFDFSRVLLNARDAKYSDSLNTLHKQLSRDNNYNPLDHFAWNEPLIDFILRLKETYPLYVFTTGSIQNDPRFQSLLDPIFKQIFTVEKIKYAKDNQQAYAVLANILELNTEEILFVDDTSKNIIAAKDAGMHAIHFVSTQQTINEIKKAFQ